MPVSAEALKAMTGLTNMTWQEMDRVSQGMIDGCAHYAGDPEIEARCNDCTASIDRHISERIRQAPQDDDMSLLAVRGRAGLSDGQMRANIKLAISGGQNEPRDAIAGIARALLEYPDALADLKTGEISYLQVFEEFTRWIAPIGMSPRKITQPYEFKDIRFDLNDRVFLMFGSGNRDESIFENPNAFNPHRDTSKSITFGAGPHFCAGSWASKSLIVDVALPMLLEAFPSLKLTAEITFTGWAFRGPLSVPAEW
jgi:cytochrome P450